MLSRIRSKKSLFQSFNKLIHFRKSLPPATTYLDHDNMKNMQRLLSEIEKIKRAQQTTYLDHDSLKNIQILLSEVEELKKEQLNMKNKIKEHNEKINDFEEINNSFNIRFIDSGLCDSNNNSTSIIGKILTFIMMYHITALILFLTNTVIGWNFFLLLMSPYVMLYVCFVCMFDNGQ